MNDLGVWNLATTCRFSQSFMLPGDPPQSLSLWSTRSPQSFSMKSCTITARSSLDSLLPSAATHDATPAAALQLLSSNCLVEEDCGPKSRRIQAAAAAAPGRRGCCCGGAGRLPPPPPAGLRLGEDEDGTYGRRGGSPATTTGMVCSDDPSLKSARHSQDNPLAAAATGQCMAPL